MNKKKTKNKHKKSIFDYLRRTNVRLLISAAVVMAVLLIFASYAWLSASLNVKVKFLDLSVSSDHGIFISLDGIDFSDSVEISLDSIVTNLFDTYPNHTNQWSSVGLWPVSSNGIRTPNHDKFDVFIGDVVRYKDRRKPRTLTTALADETEPSHSSIYIAFDIFLKNVSGSPKSDNLYLTNDTAIDFEESTTEEVKTAMQGIMNSMRFGFVKIGSVSSKSDINTIQNIKCNNNCQMVIYEPNSKSHTQASIEAIGERYGIELIDGQYYPSYGIIKEGKNLQHMNGHPGTGIPLDTEHFALQQTIFEEDFERPIFQVPNGITKMRVYVWIEGQDLDSLETNSQGSAVYISIDFEKDMAGYE